RPVPALRRECGDGSLREGGAHHPAFVERHVEQRRIWERAVRHGAAAEYRPRETAGAEHTPVKFAAVQQRFGEVAPAEGHARKALLLPFLKGKVLPLKSGGGRCVVFVCLLFHYF